VSDAARFRMQVSVRSPRKRATLFTYTQVVSPAAVLKDAGVRVQVFGAKDTDHGRINANLGVEGDPATAALWAFVASVVTR
jgi:hypothetical protein